MLHIRLSKYGPNSMRIDRGKRLVHVNISMAAHQSTFRMHNTIRCTESESSFTEFRRIDGTEYSQ